jgi:hypothetical protein
MPPERFAVDDRAPETGGDGSLTAELLMSLIVSPIPPHDETNRDDVSA